MERVGRNLILNSNFFKGGENWQDWGEPKTREIVNINGKNWARIVSTPNARWQGFNQVAKSGTILPGNAYTVSLRIRGGRQNQKFDIGIHWLDSAGKILSQSWYHDGNNTTIDENEQIVQWTVISYEGQELDHITLMIGFNSPEMNESYEIYFTDIKVEKGTTATAWTPAPEDRFGRNLLLRSKSVGGPSGAEIDENGFTVGVITSDGADWIETYPLLSQSASGNPLTGKKITISADFQTSDVQYINYMGFGLGTFEHANYDSKQGTFRIDDKNIYVKDFTVMGENLANNEWCRIEYTWEISSDWTSNEAQYYALQIKVNGTDGNVPSGVSMKYRKCKVEIGDIATPWSPAPEDSPSYGQAYLVQPMSGRAKSIRSAVIELDRSSWTYDGSRHAPKVTKVTLGGKALVEDVDYVYRAAPETNAGNYSASVLGIGDYDGTASVPWTIDKAANTITASPNDVTITGLEGTSERVTLSFAGDGAVTVSGSAHVTAQVDGHTLTLTSVREGEDTLTVTVGEGTNYLSASCTVRASVIIANRVFEDNSWDLIAAVCAAGRAREFWNIGDEKSFTRNGETYHFQIGGFDHDDIDPTDTRYGDPAYNGGKNKAAITLIMKEVFSDNYRMNATADNSTSWRDSEMRTATIPQIKSEMDQDLISAIRKVTKKTAQSGKNSTLLSTTDDLFIMSEIEVFGNSNKSTAGEGSYYEFFQSGNSTIKYQNGIEKFYWTRSPFFNYTNLFLIVSQNASTHYNANDKTSGLALCACI